MSNAKWKCCFTATSLDGPDNRHACGYEQEYESKANYPSPSFAPNATITCPKCRKTLFRFVSPCEQPGCSVVGRICTVDRWGHAHFFCKKHSTGAPVYVGTVPGKTVYNTRADLIRGMRRALAANKQFNLSVHTLRLLLDHEVVNEA